MPVPNVSYECPRRKMTDVGFFLAHEWHTQGRSLNYIARRLKVAWRTVRDHLGKSKPPSERRCTVIPPRMSLTKLTELKQRRELVKYYQSKKICVQRRHYNTRGPKARPVTMTRREFPSCASISRKLAISHGIVATPMTVRRDLWHWGACARRRPKAPRLRVGDPEQRVNFCKAISRNLQPSRLLFSDEKYFDCNDHGCVWEWVMPGEKPEPRGRDRWAPKVHVWAMIGVGIKKLVVLPRTTVTADVYRDKCLKPSLSLMRSRMFMQDGAKAHTSRLVEAYLKQRNVEVMPDWPPRSPDLNPLENLWAILARKVNDCGPTDVKELTTYIQKVWKEFSQDEVNKLVCTFSSRVKRCITNKGRHV